MEKLQPNRIQLPNQSQVFVDSCAFVARIHSDDTHYHQARSIFETLRERRASLVTSSYVVTETVTILGHQGGQILADTFLEILSQGQIPIIHIDEVLQKTALSIFQKQTMPEISVIDCANVAVMRQLGLDTIFSFEHFYPKLFDLQIAGE